MQTLTHPVSNLTPRRKVNRHYNTVAPQKQTSQEQACPTSAPHTHQHSSQLPTNSEKTQAKPYHWQATNTRQTRDPRHTGTWKWTRPKWTSRTKQALTLACPRSLEWQVPAGRPEAGSSLCSGFLFHHIISTSHTCSHHHATARIGFSHTVSWCEAQSCALCSPNCELKKTSL